MTNEDARANEDPFGFDLTKLTTEKLLIKAQHWITSLDKPLSYGIDLRCIAKMICFTSTVHVEGARGDGNKYVFWLGFFAEGHSF